MKITPEFRELFNNLLKAQKGVVTTDDLKTIIQVNSSNELYRQIRKLISEKLLYKACRGVYVSNEFSPERLAFTINPNSYLGLNYALAYHNMIGTYSPKRIQVLSSKRHSSIKVNGIELEFKLLSKDYFFGLNTDNTIRISDREKTIIDVLFYYQKGTKYYFDIYSDIYLDGIDRKKINQYLSKFKNQKFVSFVKDYLNDQTT